ncbi:MAG: glutamyl-tRNA reductase [Thermomicrobium sp.]|nr:glutamyl-tRNA reductase [Thermomicrobium sp.]
MQLASVAITHRTAPIEVRERLGFPLERQIELLGTWRDRAHEAVLLVTCHRTELYWVADAADPRIGVEWLAAAAGMEASELESCAWLGREVRAVRHLMRVAAGLDSRVLGETQILGQVRRARALAREAGTLGPILDRLISLALAAGRAARIRAGLTPDERSLARLAVQEAERHFGSLAGRSVLVLGAGDTGQLAVAALSRRRPRAVFWSNRSRDRFPRWASENGIVVLDWSDWPARLQEVDAVIVATGAPEPVVRRPHFAVPRRPQLVIDLAVPRNVEPSVAELPDIRLVTVDDLREDPCSDSPEAPPARAELVVATYVERFLRWYRAHLLAPELEATQLVLRALSEREIARAFRAAGVDPQPVAEVIRRAARSLTEKTLAPVYRAIDEDPERAASTLRVLRGA